MGSVGFPLKLPVCILIFLILEIFCDSCDKKWCYYDPSCGPDTWQSIGYCGGLRQSPIDIDTDTVIPKFELGPIIFTGYEDRKLAKLIKNKGYQLEIVLQLRATITTSSLNATYVLHQAHFHWGTEDINGAEHTINGKRYSMEMHLVHTKNNLTIEEALKIRDGLIVLAFLIDKSNDFKQITPWNTLAGFLKNIPEKDDSVKLDGDFSLGGLLRMADVSRYYTYEGSLTNPDCQEAVIWIVFENPIMLSRDLVKTFTNSLYFTTIKEDKPLQCNFRPTQPLNGRKVYYYKENK